MRLNLLISFLFAFTLTNAQFYITNNGKRVFSYGDNVRGGAVHTPEPTPDFTIYKSVDFSENTIIGENTEANIQSIWNSGFSQTINPVVSFWDSVVVVDNDTVWKVILDAENGDQGTMHNGPLRANGVNTDGDTLTYMNITYNVFFPSDFVWSAGSKLFGVAGRNRSGVVSANPPSGGMYAPGCGTSPEYLSGCGWSERFSTSFDGPPPGQFAVYTYHHDLDWNSCGSKTYGKNVQASDLGQKGEWVKVTIRTILNTVTSEGTGLADGIMELYRNDTLVAQKTDVQHRNYSDITIDWIFGAILTRGDVTRTEDTYVLFDDFILWRETNHGEYRTARNIGYVIVTP